MKLAQIEYGVVVNAAEVTPESIPDFMSDWPELFDGAGIGWTWNGESFAPPSGPPAEQLLAEAKASARQYLTDAISTARTAMITDLPGQDMIYLAKEAEARAWIADPAPDPEDYPLLVAEIGITAPSAAELAQLWLNLASLWRTTAAQLEALRMAVGGAIEAAETVEDVDAALVMIEAAGLPT